MANMTPGKAPKEKPKKENVDPALLRLLERKKTPQDLANEKFRRDLEAYHIWRYGGHGDRSLKGPTPPTADKFWAAHKMPKAAKNDEIKE